MATPDPLEPIVHADTGRAGIQMAAMQRALGRIRYIAKGSPEVADVFDVMDKALASALSIPVDEVPGATGTAPAMSDEERALERLLAEAKLVSALTDADRVGILQAMDLEFQSVWQKVTGLVAMGELNHATAILQQSSYVTTARFEKHLATLAHCLEAAEFRRNPPTRT
ncbi:hypothetical protein ACFPC0_10700 [Streptomyces andamanensis]|uniref:Uncharacterized protein n=1 Tax=Streptomyces andamanensis TaxID=1565035 RepID=A0ABV8TCR9_9ACTN